MVIIIRGHHIYKCIWHPLNGSVTYNVTDNGLNIATCAQKKNVRLSAFRSFYLLARAPSWILGPRVILTMREFASRVEKQDALWCASTRSTLRLFHTFARPPREIPHLRKCPYKEGVVPFNIIIYLIESISCALIQSCTFSVSQSVLQREVLITALSASEEGWREPLKLPFIAQN